ncbi:MAG TPA: hypothetical protein VH988_14195 [Thermoanaerobaculia bacterium]|jgi:hypothetical protein|nr:hypothetical protein [Thermoanaerobaculia bacterium]
MMNRRIHRACPERPGASPAQPNAFQARPFAQPAVQRFSVIQPNDYQTAAVHAGQMFPSQVLDQSRTTTPSDEATQVTQRLSWVNRYAANPPLKVSEHGQLAMESTTGQPKVFYGTAGAVAANRMRLIDIGSRITLKANSSETLQAPRNPENIDGNSVTLVQVEPEKSPDVDVDEELMDANECDSVSERIVRGKKAVIGNAQEGLELAGSVSARQGDINYIATAIHGTRAREPLSAFPQKIQQAKSVFPNVNDTRLPISQEVRDYFAEGFFRRSHLVPADQILKALSLPGIPQALWAQIYELHVGKTEEQRPLAPYVLNHIKKVLRIQRVQEYETVRNDARRNARLGVNEFAAPEVGESFSIIAQTSPSVVDESGVLSHDLSFSNLDAEEIAEIYEDLLIVQTNAQLLGTLADNQYAKAQGIVPYQEHHAAVVARDGDDTVTFENYNRSGEEDSLKTDLWEALLNEFEDFDAAVQQDIEQVRDDPEREPVTKLNNITRLRKQHLETMRQDFVAIEDDTSLKVESNLGENPNQLWHFNMYGPAHRQQSFHDVWSPAVANAITVRTTGTNEEFLTGRLVASIRARVEQVAERLSEQSSQSVEEIVNGFLDPIRNAQTRIEASEAYRESLARLESNE